MDNISIEIQSSSDKASQGVTTLIESLSNLNSKLSDVQNNATKYSKSMQNIGNILKNIKTPKLPKATEISKVNKNDLQKSLQNKNANITNQNNNKNKKDVKEVNKSVQELSKLTAEAGNRIKKMLSYLGKVVIAKGALKGLNSIFGGLGSKVAGLSNNFRNLAKNLSKYSLALFGIRSAFYAVRNTSNEFLSSQDALAKQLNTNISYLKFSIGSMFAPVIEYITNLIYKLLQAIQALVYYFSKINIFAGKTANNYAAMANSGSKATKEAQKQLQAFDELNNISLEKNDNSGGAGNIAPSFDLSGIREDLLPKFDDIENLFKDFANKINGFLGSIKWDSIIEKTTTATRKIANALNAFTKQLDFGLIGYSIGQGINAITANLNTFFDTYDFNTLGKKIGQGLNNMVYTINWQDLGKSLTNGFKAAVDVLFNFVTTVQWKDLGIKIGTAIKSAFANIDWGKTGETINKGINGILDTIIEILDNMDVDKIAKDIGEMLSKIDFGKIFTKVLQIAGKVLEGLGKILWESIFSGDGDLAKILFIIIDFIAIKKLVGLLFGTIGTSLQNNLVTSMSKAKTEGKGLTDTLNGTSGAASTLGTGISNLSTSLGKAAQAIAVLGGIRLVLDGLTNLLKTFAKTGLSVGEALGFLAGAVTIVVVAFAAMMAVIKGLKPSWQSIAGAAVVLAGFSAVLLSVSMLLDSFAQSGMNAGEVALLMLAIFTPIVGLMATIAVLGPLMTVGLIPFLGVIAGISALLAVMAITLPPILDAAGKFIETIAPAVILAIREIFNGIENLIKALGEILPPIIDSLGKFFEKVFNAIATIIEKVGKIIIEVFKEAGKIIETIFKGVAKTFETIFNGISKVAETVGVAIEKVFNGVSNVLGTIFNGIGNVFSSVFNGIANVANAVGNVITSIFNGISTVIETIGRTVERILNSIANLIERVLNVVLRFTWEIGPAVENSVNAILRSVTRVVNFIVSAIEYLVNTVVIGGVNTIIRAINSISQYVGINIPLVPTISIPRFTGYANGGFPTEGELFIANESGPEMIGSIGNKTAVANNDQITKAIAQATYSAFVQALGENSGNEGQPLNIYIGNEKVYKGYTKQQSQMSNQYGIVI